jgi:hypothetical protein
MPCEDTGLTVSLKPGFNERVHRVHFRLLRCLLLNPFESVNQSCWFAPDNFHQRAFSAAAAESQKYARGHAPYVLSCAISSFEGVVISAKT